MTIALRIPTTLILSLLFILNATAQQKDEVRLHNGSIVKGIIITKDSANVSIETMGGSVFVFTHEEILEVVDIPNHNRGNNSNTLTEPMSKDFKRPKLTPKEFNVDDILDKGVGLSYGKGLLFGSSAEGGLRIAMSYSLINYFQFKYHYKIGIGVSFQTYRMALFPFYTHFEYTLTKAKRSPFFYVQLGGALPMKGRNDLWWGREPDSKGGITAEIGMGIKRYVSEKSSIMLSFGYHYQTHEFTRYDFIWDDFSQTNTEIETNVKEVFSRIPIRITCEF